MSKKVLYFDVETTGLDSKIDQIVQLSYIIEVDNVVEIERNILICPQNIDYISDEVLKILGKTQSEIFMYPDTASSALIMLENDLSKYCDKYDKLDKYYYGGYNVRFDIEFLRQLFESQGDKYFGSWFNGMELDPLPILRFLDFKDKINLLDYKLSTVCEHFRIELQAHDALSDVKATRELIKLFINKNK